MKYWMGNFINSFHWYVIAHSCPSLKWHSISYLYKHGMLCLFWYLVQYWTWYNEIDLLNIMVYPTAVVWSSVAWRSLPGTQFLIQDIQCWRLIKHHWTTFLSENIFSCDQAALQMVFASVCPSVRLSVRLSVCHTFLTMFQSSYHHEIFRSYYQWPK